MSNLYPGFDSILVRLKAKYVSLIRQGLMFRFHTGSIKSLAMNERWKDAQTFRFHTGSIKRSEDDPPIVDTETGFDSILVRLKVHKRVTNYAYPIEFRFHTGSIKRALFRHL